MGRGGVHVVSVLDFYSDGPSSNTAESCSFFVNFVFLKTKIKQKESGIGPF